MLKKLKFDIFSVEFIYLHFQNIGLKFRHIAEQSLMLKVHYR